MTVEDSVLEKHRSRLEKGLSNEVILSGILSKRLLSVQ